MPSRKTTPKTFPAVTRMSTIHHNGLGSEEQRGDHKTERKRRGRRAQQQRQRACAYRRRPWWRSNLGFTDHGARWARRTSGCSHTCRHEGAAASTNWMSTGPRPKMAITAGSFGRAKPAIVRRGDGRDHHGASSQLNVAHDKPSGTWRRALRKLRAGR